MCRTQPERIRCNADKSSLRSSRMLDAEHSLYGHRGPTMHDSCQKCGALFTDSEKDLHLNHYEQTEWAGTISITLPICQKCRDADPEKGYSGPCNCDCYKCKKSAPRDHCGAGEIHVMGGVGTFLEGCRRFKFKGRYAPIPHIYGDLRYAGEFCKCDREECVSKRRRR